MQPTLNRPPHSREERSLRIVPVRNRRPDKMKIVTVVCVLLLQESVRAYKSYEDRIPNGIQVPHPCRPNVFWKGVGHKDYEGGSIRNPFGVDFAANSHVWDETICRKDSDGDGKTNGQELGDPNCKWRAGTGMAPEKLTDLSHPGICEPLDSEMCRGKNDWEVCKEEAKFECGGIKEPGVMNTTLRVVPTKIPQQATSYYCILMDLPSDGDYHLIASKPVIDNAYVMHHMVLYGCDYNPGGELDNYIEPNDCAIMPDTCTETLAIWTLGDPGMCIDGPYGFRMGKKAVTKALLQFHWTNVELKNDYVDSSGMTLYYTKNLRKYDGGVMVIGQTELPIPPQMPRVEHQGWCSSDCSEKIYKNETIYISKSNLHMHYLGDSGGIELYRKGKLDQTLLWQDSYDYDSPLFIDHKDPIKFKGGDAMKVTCVYKSSSRKNMTTFGLGTLDEMCFGIFWYYPKTSDTYCGQHGDYEVCFDPDESCRAESFVNSDEAKDMFLELAMACDTQKCSRGCEEKVKEVQKHPCLKPGPNLPEFLTELYKVYGTDEATEIFQMLVSCGLKPAEQTSANEVNHKEMPTFQRPYNSNSEGQGHTGMSQLGWKDQVQFMKDMKEVVCGGGSTLSWSLWMVLAAAYFAKSVL